MALDAAMNRSAADLFDFKQRIGSGSFGEVFIAVDRRRGDRVAVKVEAAPHKTPRLLQEAQIYKKLAGRPGFAQLRYCGMEARRNVLVVSLLGASLGELFRSSGRRFSFKTVCMLADQLIDRLEVFHELGWVHRDIKPENCLMGRDEEMDLVHLIDFGLAKRFCRVDDGVHIESCQHKVTRGTVHFASLNACRAMEQSRRDDLEALGFMLVYFLRGNLPWQGRKAYTRTVQLHTIVDAKGAAAFGDLCSGFEGSEVLGEYLRYCRRLDFKERPDYTYLRRLFSDAMHAKVYNYDFGYDWVVARQSSSSSLEGP